MNLNYLFVKSLAIKNLDFGELNELKKILPKRSNTITNEQQIKIDSDKLKLELMNKEIEEFKKSNDEEMEKEIENCRKTHMSDIEGKKFY